MMVASCGEGLGSQGSPLGLSAVPQLGWGRMKDEDEARVWVSLDSVWLGGMTGAVGSGPHIPSMGGLVSGAVWVSVLGPGPSGSVVSRVTLSSLCES